MVSGYREKVRGICVLLVTHLEAADRVCAALQVQLAQLGHNVSAPEVVQNRTVSLCILFGEDLNTPSFAP